MSSREWAIYAAWSGLTPQELRQKCKPYMEVIEVTWDRLKRAAPEMQSAKKEFVKPKWDEAAYFQGQVRERAKPPCRLLYF